FNYSPDIELLAEDWTGAAWVHTDGPHKHFMVSGRMESPNFEEPFEGARLMQLETVLAAKRNSDVMIIGLGVGITAGNIAKDLPTSRVTVVDYSPAVVKLAGVLSAYNAGVVDAPNAQVIVADGRMALQTEARAFDIVMEMASGDGTPGTSAIKSAQFFQTIKSHLKPGGFYVGVGGSLCTIRAAQSAFRNTYFLPWFLVATEGDLATAFDFDKLKRLRHELHIERPASVAARSRPEGENATLL